MTFPDKNQVFGLKQRSFVTAADYNGDGVPDLLAVGPCGTSIQVALGPVDETQPVVLTDQINLAPKPVLGEGGYIHIQSFAVADWDRDGKPDLVVRRGMPDGSLGIYWYSNLGGRGLTKLGDPQRLVEITREMQVQAFAVCDWNGDGWLDLIISRSDEPVKDADDQHVGWRWSAWLYARE